MCNSGPVSYGLLAWAIFEVVDAPLTNDGQCISTRMIAPFRPEFAVFIHLLRDLPHIPIRDSFDIVSDFCGTTTPAFF